MITLHPSAERQMTKEPGFQIFKHAGLLCCVQRMNWSGVLNGYVAVPKDHPLFGKHYSENVVVPNKEAVEFNGNYLGLLCHALSPEADTNLLSLDCAINVHGGLTFSSKSLNGMDESVFPDLWWFGFDTNHCDDLKPYQSDIDRQFGGHGTYRDFEYTKGQTMKLAEQLSQYGAAPLPA